MAGADAGPRQDKQTVLGQERPQLVHEREDRLMAAIHDGAAADLHDLHPREERDRASAGDGIGETAVKEGLARERRGDVLDLAGVVHGDGSLSVWRSEVRIFCAASPECGLLNQSHTRSISC